MIGINQGQETGRIFSILRDGEGNLRPLTIGRVYTIVSGVAVLVWESFIKGWRYGKPWSYGKPWRYGSRST